MPVAKGGMSHKSLESERYDRLKAVMSGRCYAMKDWKFREVAFQTISAHAVEFHIK